MKFQFAQTIENRKSSRFSKIMTSPNDCTKKDINGGKGRTQQIGKEHTCDNLEESSGS